MRHITATATASVTDYMGMGNDVFALDVVAHGITVRFHKLSVVDGRPCEIRGFLTSIVGDDGVQPATTFAVFDELNIGSHSIVDTQAPADLGYSIRWSGGQLEGSRTFCARDFARHVISAIGAVISLPIAA